MSDPLVPDDSSTPTHSALRERVDRELAAFLDRCAPDFTSPEPLAGVFDLLRAFVLGAGKRIRPLFCYWGWRGAGGRDCDEVVRAAAALELFQAFALVHDDIMDRSDVRRGEPALHRSLEELHVRGGWRGHGGHFGMSVAILCGDLLLSFSDELLHGCGLPSWRVRSAQELVHRMRTEVMIGQNLDLLDQATGGSLEGALRIIRLKAAKYTIERPLHVGALLGGGPPALLDGYSRFAIPLGEAFQLRDDVLGVFGDAAVTGKSVVDDLREGKPTVLVALARERAHPHQAARLRELHGHDDLDEDGAAALRQIMVETGALATVETMIQERHTAALRAAELLPVSAEVSGALLELAAASTVRAS